MEEHPFVSHMRKELGAASLKRPVSREEFYEFVGGTIDELAGQMKLLRERIDQLEAADSYKGTWQRALAYRKGAQVTHKSSLWVALGNVSEGTVPGENPASWQLAAKGAG